ncbi:MAG: sigma-70 family RNA polymerase sigma factor [Defluviitaleaceae bacterium]|nr:sigma-70 family RNA polymerase sigma factor [Defluviitaleaceae bacterium]
MNDDEIVKMLFDRTEDSIEELRKKYEQKLFKISMNFLNNKQDAEECVNDAFLKVWNTIPPYRPTVFCAYLYKLVRNISLNRLKAKNAQKRGGGDISIILEELENCVTTTKNNTPEELYESSLTTKAINDFLASLKKTERMTFVLRYFYGDSIQDICQRFDFSESKVKSLLFRLRKRLQVYLEKEGVAL